MENERVKFTYRYSDDIDVLLKKAIKKKGVTSLNKLIDSLIFDALVNMPKEIENINKCLIDVKVHNAQLKEMNNSLGKELNNLKSLVKQEIDTREKLKLLIS